MPQGHEYEDQIHAAEAREPDEGLREMDEGLADGEIGVDPDRLLDRSLGAEHGALIQRKVSLCTCIGRLNAGADPPGD
jgi:hypothetical protein